jgi:hypothetical protein
MKFIYLYNTYLRWGEALMVCLQDGGRIPSMKMICPLETGAGEGGRVEISVENMVSKREISNYVCVYK